MNRQMTDFGGLRSEFEGLFQQGGKFDLLSGRLAIQCQYLKYSLNGYKPLYLEIGRQCMQK